MLFLSAVDLDLQGCGSVRTRVELHHGAMKWTRQAYLNTCRDLLVRLGFKWFLKEALPIVSCTLSSSIFLLPFFPLQFPFTTTPILPNPIL